LELHNSLSIYKYKGGDGFTKRTISTAVLARTNNNAITHIRKQQIYLQRGRCTREGVVLIVFVRKEKGRRGIYVRVIYVGIHCPLLMNSPEKQA